MTLVLIGSRALAIQAPKLLRRQPLDFDYIATQDGFDAWQEQFGRHLSVQEEIQISENKKAIKAKEGIIEFEFAKKGTNSEQFLSLVSEDSQSKETKLGTIPSLDMLFALKTSHRYLKDSPHFWKNLFDYHAMKKAGAKVRPEWSAWLKQREKETYTHKTPKLMGVNKKDFFNPNSGVNYLWDHDSIHEVFSKKYTENGDVLPAYRHYILPNSQVECSKDLFFNKCSEEIRLRGVLEESYVLAMERSQIPFPGRLAPKESFKIAFSKVCTSITSGWFREFAYDNALRVLSLYEDSYVDLFFDAVKNGKVKPYEKDKDSNPYK